MGERQARQANAAAKAAQIEATRKEAATRTIVPKKKVPQRTKK